MVILVYGVWNVGFDVNRNFIWFYYCLYFDKLLVRFWVKFGFDVFVFWVYGIYFWGVFVCCKDK